MLGTLAGVTYAAEYTESQKAMQYLLVAECVVASPEEIDSKLAYLIEYHRDVHDIKRLLEAGADPDGTNVKIQASGATNRRPTEGVPYLYKCVQGNTNVEVMKLLIEAGANVTPKLNNNLTLIHLIAVGFGNYTLYNPTRWKEGLDMLIKGGVDVNQQTGDGITALMIAAESAQIELVKYLLENGADCSLSHSNGNKAINFVPTGHKYTAEIRQLLNSATK